MRHSCRQKHNPLEVESVYTVWRLHIVLVGHYDTIGHVEGASLAIIRGVTFTVLVRRTKLVWNRMDYMLTETLCLNHNMHRYTTHHAHVHNLRL
jgi:hypothetical protein